MLPFGPKVKVPPFAGATAVATAAVAAAAAAAAILLVGHSNDRSIDRIVRSEQHCSGCLDRLVLTTDR